MGKFTSKDQPKRKRGKSGRTLVLDGIQEAVPSVQDRDTAERYYWKVIAQRAFNPDDKDSHTLLKVMADKGWSSLKSTMATVDFEFPQEGTPTDKAFAVVEAISNGALAPDIGQVIIGIIKDAVVIEESTDLKARIEELETKLGLADG